MSSSPSWPVDPLWHALLPAAMVGTERTPPPRLSWPPELAATVGALLDQLAQGRADEAGTPDPARTLLRTAGVLGLCGRAGHSGWPLPGVQPLPPAPADARPAVADPACLATLARVLADGSPAHLGALLQPLQAGGWRLPASLLPAALEQGRRHVALRPVLQAVLGERGRWLASQTGQPGSWAAGVAASVEGDTLWQEGSLVQRGQWLAQQRQSDPAAARQRLQASLPELPAKERAELLSVLAHNLSVDDEPLLNQLRQDRSREVREVVRGLLMRLPGSSFSQRSTARVAALLRHELFMLVGRTWVIEPPTAADPDWQVDDIAATCPKGEHLGQRGWWLMTLVSQVPPAWWRSTLDMNGHKLLAWAHNGDWAHALLQGWYRALLAVPDAPLALALLERWPKILDQFSPAPLLTTLSSSEREVFFIQRLRAGQGLGETLARLSGLDASAPALLSVLPTLLAATPPGQCFSEALSGALLTGLPAAIAHLNKLQRWGWGGENWRNRFTDMVALLAPVSLAQVLTLDLGSLEIPCDLSTVALDRQRFLALPLATAHNASCS